MLQCYFGSDEWGTHYDVNASMTLEITVVNVHMTYRANIGYTVPYNIAQYNTAHMITVINVHKGYITHTIARHVTLWR